MPVLSPETVLVNDGDIKLYKRARSRVWQATFNIDGQWVRVSAKHKDLEEAKVAAKKLMMEYQFRQKHQLPVVSKRFGDVARLAILEMNKALAADVGKKTYLDYIIVIERYLIPFFGRMLVENINYETLRDFDRWRVAKMGREPKASTLNTHNSALNRVFDEAIVRGFLSASHKPLLKNNGLDSERRPDFTLAEYRSLIRGLPSWIEHARDGKSREMRLLLRDYVLILANTGIREGTEADNLLWQHVHVFQENGKQFLELSVDGKTGRRDIICRANTLGFLKRIHARCEDINHMSFEALLKAKLNKPVFRLSDGTVTKNLRQTFKAFLKAKGLLVCSRTGQNRTLYSLRHTYATFALTTDGMEIHTLAKQMGTSIKMIEDHYSHLTPRLKKDMLTGPRYELHTRKAEDGSVEQSEMPKDEDW